MGYRDRVRAGAWRGHRGGHAETLLRTLFDADPDHPDRLTHLGLLALCRQGQPRRSHRQQARDWLALARLRADLNSDDSDSLYEHAVVALMSEMPAEAEQAIARFAQHTPTWDRPSTVVTSTNSPYSTPT